jgi:UPF0271 protein
MARCAWEGGRSFADRAYTLDGSLVSRREQGSVLHEADLISERCVAMAKGEPIQDAEGGELVLDARSICVQGATSGAVTIARSVRDALAGAGVTVQPIAAA